MNATTHPVAPEEIMALLDGELTADRAQSVSRHVEECTDCRILSQQLRSTAQSLASWDVQCPPASIADGVFAGAATASQPAPPLSGAIFHRTKLWTWKQWLGGLAAAGALSVLFLIVSTPHLLRSPQEASEAFAVAGRIAKQHGGTTPGDTVLVPQNRALAVFSNTLQEQIEPEEQADKIYRSWIPSGPMIARTVSFSIIAKDFAASRTALDTILTRHRGYAASLAVSSEQNAARSLQASLRIPAGELNAAISDLKSLGSVQNETQNGEEVSQQHADLVARLQNSRQTEARLQDILRNRTGKISDVLAVEQEIARVRGEIEQMEAEQKSLEHRVDFATVDLKLSEEYKAHLDSRSPSVPTRFHNAFVAGFRAAAETLIGILLFLAEAGPSLLIWLIVLGPICWLLWRRWRRSIVIAS